MSRVHESTEANVKRQCIKKKRGRAFPKGMIAAIKYSEEI